MPKVCVTVTVCVCVWGGGYRYGKSTGTIARSTLELLMIYTIT